MTFKNKLLPAVAAAGLLVALAIAIGSESKPPPARPVTEPAQAPFKDYIGGSGIVEARTENISMGASLPGIVKTVFVAVGEKVQAGQPLFDIDDREHRAELLVRQASLLKARTALEEARAALQDVESQFALVRGVTDGRVVSVDDVQKRRDAALLGKAKVESARAALVYAEAEVKSTQTAIDRLTVRAPLDCEVLQVNVRPGQYAATGVLDTPLMLLGNLDQLHIRVDIDENDAWRFKAGARAMAYVRGNRDLRAEAVFVRVEPYVKPKTSLTGSSTEKVDTRVLQVIFSFDRNILPVYVGQQMDVFVETPENPRASREGGRG